MEASIHWHAYGEQKTPHVCLYQRPLKSCKMNERFVLEPHQGMNQDS